MFKISYSINTSLTCPVLLDLPSLPPKDFAEGFSIHPCYEEEWSGTQTAWEMSEQSSRACPAVVPQGLQNANAQWLQWSGLIDAQT